MTHDYLKPIDDGLAMRQSQDYAKQKLEILSRFMQMFTTAMKERPWAALNYIDLLAGPGKNMIGKSGEFVLGSPLLALEYPFDNFFFVEEKENNYECLDARVSASPRSSSVRLMLGDCNLETYRIVEGIQAIESDAAHGAWQSLNLVFADPEGLEIHWDTIAILGRETRSDLIINFSTSGITRNIRVAFNSQREHAIDRFLGSRDWRKQYSELPNPSDGTAVRRHVLDL